MPGMLDPANVALPQQPFHPCLFPHSSRFNTFERVPNPTQFIVDDIVIAGHSGQPLNDIARQTFAVHEEVLGGDLKAIVEEDPQPVPLQSMDSMPMEIDETVVELEPKPMKLKSDLKDGERRIDIFQDTLEWGHLAPTIPGKQRSQ